MPKFRFEFVEDSRQPPIHLEMANIEVAVSEAKRAAKESMLDGLVSGTDPTGWLTRVYDEAGYLVATVSFHDLVGPADGPAEKADPIEVPGVMRSG